MFCNVIWSVTCIDLDLISTNYAAALRNTGHPLPNEYIYCINGMNRLRDKIWMPKSAAFFSHAPQPDTTQKVH